MRKTMAIFRKHCLGPGDVDLCVRGTFNNGHKVNFEDENLGICMPVFIIHGNHDDPIREGNTVKALSPIDLLAEAGLVNYFGVVEDAMEAEIKPILIEKGEVEMKLYGMGWMRDERMFRMFEHDKIKFLQGVDDDHDSSFNMMLVHQNRDHKGRGTKNCFRDNMIPIFMNLCVFGHEHECLIDPSQSIHSDRTYLSQPGSSIVTSLSREEASPKQVMILEISKNVNGTPEFRWQSFSLASLRPFAFAEISLEDICPESLKTAAEDEQENGITEALYTKVKVLLAEAKANYREEHGKACTALPLLRLRVEYSGFTTVNIQRFGCRLQSKVANPNSVLQFFKMKKVADDARPMLDIEEEPATSEDAQKRISNLVVSNLSDGEHGLKLFTGKGLSDIIENTVVKGEPRLLLDFLNDHLDLCRRQLEGDSTLQMTDNSKLFGDAIESKIAETAETRSKEVLNNPNASKPQKKKAVIEESSDDELSLPPLKKPKKTSAAKSKAKASTKTKTDAKTKPAARGTRAKPASNAVVVDLEDSDSDGFKMSDEIESEEVTSSVKKRPRISKLVETRKKRIPARAIKDSSEEETVEKTTSSKSQSGAGYFASSKNASFFSSIP